MKKFIFHWIDGTTEIGIGDNVLNAFRRLGYGGGAARTLDYWEEINDDSN